MSLLGGGADIKTAGRHFQTGHGVTTDKIVSAAGPIKHNQAGGRAACSTFRVAPADVVKALLDCGEARFDHRLKFEVGEDIWPVLFDAFADEFTDIVGIYALRDAFPDHIDVLGKWARSRQGTDRPLKALGEIAT
jgi:hypothetical protein